MLDGQTLLITGGTGSFGNAILKGFLHSGLKEIRIFSRDEKKQDEMRKAFNNDKIKFYIGDVRILESVREAVKGADFVFHAAALKQVPSCEFFPMEAVRTNIIGTDNVLTAAIDAGVKKVICLSTDKAAYPVNAMGISKAMMEKIVAAKSRTVDPEKTLICCTRYGNVMASRGSVIPIFTSQIKEGRPVTMTDPEMTRFLMNLDEAVELVMLAFQHARQGDLFVKKAPAATLGTLTRALTELYGLEAKVKIIGTRHGEKTHETLLTREERAKAEDMGGFFRVPADARDLNYGTYLEENEGQLEDAIEYTSSNTERLDVEATKKKLLTVAFVRSEVGTK
jgi:UDP-N-acetylglucosamine 4,6-dehydratase